MKFALLLILLCCPFCEGQTIYATEFEEYEDGAENLDDWIGIQSPGQVPTGLIMSWFPASRIPLLSDLNVQTQSLVTLVKAHDFDPVAAGTPTVILEVAFGS